MFDEAEFGVDDISEEEYNRLKEKNNNMAKKKKKKGKKKKAKSKVNHILNKFKDVFPKLYKTSLTAICNT